jgi:D-alanine-D-alanine ligase-like ATP-grasp enzyme
MAEKSASVLQRQVAGVDIIVNEDTGEPYILEVNPAPGFTYDMDEPPEVKALANYLQSF